MEADEGILEAVPVLVLKRKGGRAGEMAWGEGASDASAVNIGQPTGTSEEEITA
jgi:hypothetical protein